MLPTLQLYLIYHIVVAIFNFCEYIYKHNAVLTPSCRRPVAVVLQSLRRPVAILSPLFCSPYAVLSPSCRRCFAVLAPSCHHPVAVVLQSLRHPGALLSPLFCRPFAVLSQSFRCPSYVFVFIVISIILLITCLYRGIRNKWMNNKINWGSGRFLRENYMSTVMWCNCI